MFQQFTEALKELMTPGGYARRYERIYKEKMGIPAYIRKTTTTYELYHHVIRKHPQSMMVTVHLHGKRVQGRTEYKRIEYITLRLLPNESEQDIIRCATTLSPNRWHVPFNTNLSQYQGRFNAPLDESLVSTLTDQSHISSS